MEKAISVLQSTLVLCLFMSILLLGKKHMASSTSSATDNAPATLVKNWQGREVAPPMASPEPVQLKEDSETAFGLHPVHLVLGTEHKAWYQHDLSKYVQDQSLEPFSRFFFTFNPHTPSLYLKKKEKDCQFEVLACKDCMSF